MSEHGLFNPDAVPAAKLIAARTPFWQGSSFSLSLAVQWDYHLVPYIKEGDTELRIGPQVDGMLAAGSLWKDLDFEVRDNGRIVRPADAPRAVERITSGDIGVIGHPPMDTYMGLTFLSANAPGMYFLFIDAMAGAFRLTQNHYSLLVTTASLTVDDDVVWSHTYTPTTLAERFVDEHKIMLKQAP